MDTRRSWMTGSNGSNSFPLLLVILFTGALLRVWDLWHIPLTHDEFSAILRCRFDNLHDLFAKGIRIDGHPAGVQLFLYFLIRIFGESPVILKLPFIISGIISIWLTYAVGKKWFNSTAGLVAACFISFLQYPIMYSQVARPYSTGLMLSLLLVLFWTNILFYPEKRYKLNLAGFSITGALCAYDHHFCMLFAGMVGITGIFLTRGRSRRNYLIACLAAMLLYLPHLPVLLHQLNIGGVEGWLQKPRFDFIADHLQYVFHFSVFVYLLVFCLISLSLYWYDDRNPIRWKFVLISFIWFIVPFLAGYFYSTYRSAVLQHSVLIFSFPFLLFLFSGLFTSARFIHQAIAVALVAMILIPSLIYGRQHYNLFYAHPYHELPSESLKAQMALGAMNSRVILDTQKEIDPFVLRQPEFKEFRFRYLEDLGGVKRLGSYLDSVSCEFIILGSISSTPAEIYPVVAEKYPYLMEHKFYHGGDFMVFSRHRTGSLIREYFYDLANDFEHIPPEWSNTDQNRCVDSMVIDGKRSFYEPGASEFSPTYQNGLRNMIRTANDVIDISADLRLPPVFPGAWLVATVSTGERIIYWSSAAVNDFIDPGKQGKIFLSVKVSDIELRHHSLMFKTYLWNPGKLPYVMDNFRVRVRSGNPVIYGLFRPVPHK